MHLARSLGFTTWRPRHARSLALPCHDTRLALTLECVEHGPTSRSALPHNYGRALGPPKRQKTRETTQSRDAATAASRLPRRPAARHAARARSGVRTARPDAVRLNPAPFRSPRAREKTGGRSREVGCVDRVKILRYVFECPRRSIGWWEVGWKVSSPREELALPRSARRTAPPCPL